MHVEMKAVSDSWLKLAAVNLFLICFFVLAGNVGFLFTSYNASSSPLWPPSGLALAMTFIFGLRNVLPGIATGIFSLAIQSHAPTVTVLGLISAGLLEVIVANIVLLALHEGKFKFSSPKEIFQFLVIACGLAPIIGSTVAIPFLYAGNMISVDIVPRVWLTFFVGDSLGIMIFTPLILSICSEEKKRLLSVEGLILFLSLAVTSFWAFEGNSIRKFIIIPFVTWAAFRFGFMGASICTMVVGTIALWRSTYLWGVFDQHSPEADLFWIQCLAAGVAIVGYFMATAVTAQTSAEKKELELTINRKQQALVEEALGILDQAINNSPTGFALIDQNYCFIRINETLAKLHGISASAHINQPLKDVLPEVTEKVIPLIGEVFLTGKSFLNIPFTLPSHLKTISGLVSYYPVRNPATNTIFAVGISFQDMTDHLRTQELLRENQDRLKFAQEAGRIGAFEWDLQTGEILWTPELESIYGLETGEFGGLYESWLKLIHPDDVGRVREEIESALLDSSDECTMLYRILTKRHETRWVLSRGRMMKDELGRHLKLVGINIDISEQKAIEQKLRLTEANLLYALSVRDEFMAIASHELKTPLTSLKLQHQIFQRSLHRSFDTSFTPEKLLDLLDKNTRHIERLTRLVDDMLDISRLRTGKLTLKKEPCELQSILLDIVGRNREQFELSGSGQPVIEQLEKAQGEWDPLRIEQVLTNIITNAIRYGQGKPIIISVKNYQDSVRISVRDQGLGIPKSDQKKIFDRYERGMLSREVSGLGIGLFITKEIVEAHSGKIWVESEVGTGSVFHVDLPRSIIPSFFPLFSTAK